MTILDTDSAIRSRQTTKVLAHEDLAASANQYLLEELLSLAGMAPFHRACEETHRQKLPGIEPWRFYVLDASHCRALKVHLPTENAGKIPAMLAAANALVLATWLPNAPSTHLQELLARSSDLKQSWIFEPTLANMEHIAAASAAIQNLLLAATARGIANYWSSGGVLRSASIFERLGIPATEILLGAVFLFPSHPPDAEVVTSKLRSHRTPSQCWSRCVKFGSAET